MADKKFIITECWGLLCKNFKFDKVEPIFYQSTNQHKRIADKLEKTLLFNV